MVTITNDKDMENGRVITVGELEEARNFTVPFSYADDQIFRVVRDYYERETKKLRELNLIKEKRKHIKRLVGTEIEVI